MKLDHARAMPPHRAGPDAWVTAHILAGLDGVDAPRRH
jgi:exodeoxyribonuclease X